jgi:cGMP-dependent protein kinase
MAPEVIIGKGYGITADYWSVGIMLYEFICGGVPFGEEEEEPIKIYEKILAHQLIYPNFIDPRIPAKSMIEQLLSKNPALRTGGTIENLLKHPWFQGLDWVNYIQDRLLTKQISSPYKPSLPKLDLEISNAKKKPVNLQSVCAREESEENYDVRRIRHRTPPPSCWDDEF